MANNGGMSEVREQKSRGTRGWRNGGAEEHSIE